MVFSSGRRTGTFIAATALGLLFATSAFAQQAKVIKVQGKKAIVQFPDDARPRVGQMIDLGGGTSIGSESHTSAGTGARSMIVGGSTELSSLTPSGASTSVTIFTVDGRYGWNKGDMEYGAIAGMKYRSTTGTSSRTLEGGGFFDYNLVPNVPGTEIVYGAGALAKFGQLSTTIGNADVSGTIMTLEVGGQGKWFPLGNSVAIRGDVVYHMESVSDSAKASASGSGLIARGGFYVYF